MWKFFIYTASGLLLTEVVYILYGFIRKKNAIKDIDGEEVADVIWTNELTQECLSNHFSYKNGYSLTPKKDTKGDVMKCLNPYCASANIGRIIRYLDNAKYSIDLAMYTFTSIQMSNALHRALRRDVIVRIITDKEMAFSTGSQVTSLTKSGAPVRFPLSASLMHHKFCIIDGVNRVSCVMKNDEKEYNAKSVKSLLLNGSLNWTVHGFNGNWENIVITSNKSLVKKFEEEFERMWIAFNIDESNHNTPRATTSSSESK